MTCEACKTIPPVIAEGYENKGSWGEVAGLKTCPQTATKALVALYDVFGPAPQTLQGADAMSSALNALVLVPDFFKGAKMEFSWYGDDLYVSRFLFPSVSCVAYIYISLFCCNLKKKKKKKKERDKGEEEEEEKKNRESKALKEAFAQYALDFPAFVPALRDVVGEGRGRWGVVALSSGPDTPFSASGQVHPGRLATTDATQITIPHIVLASDGEDAKIVREYKDVLVGAGKPGVVDTYVGMHHGWMGARANFKDEANFKEYERG
ncbi:putative AIM2 family protein [Lachnellula arida]|uniref:Putative AIM2 family protein n=1 Tax=Lachnellula arida TaxID=1316785 RepID=A0A8T9BMF7_9HELO|nr:putative AIM2 family protein [Lachnellula arida]